MRQLRSRGNGGARGSYWPLVVWTGLILLLVVPWGSYQDHSHWARVLWVPFVSPPVRARDIVANMIVYMPIGYWALRLGPTPRVWRGVAFAFALSLGTEFTQVYSHGRFPSTTDLACNVSGAWIGAYAGRRRGLRERSALVEK